MSSAANKMLNNFYKQASPSPRLVMRTLLLAEDSFATPLFLIVMDLYGMEALEWAPQTIRLQLERDFHIELPRTSLDKIMAAITIVTTNYFYKNVRKFIDLCNVLSGDDFQPDMFDPADPEEILHGVTEAMLLWPPDQELTDDEFSDEIREYISQVLQVDGIFKPFELLQIAFDGDQSAKVDTDWADDPDMYTAIYESHTTKQSQMKETYLENLQLLSQQLQILQLSNGSTEKMIEQLSSLSSVTR